LCDDKERDEERDIDRERERDEKRDIDRERERGVEGVNNTHAAIYGCGCPLLP